jgi:hypothetical protein
MKAGLSPKFSMPIARAPRMTVKFSHDRKVRSLAKNTLGSTRVGSAIRLPVYVLLVVLQGRLSLSLSVPSYLELTGAEVGWTSSQVIGGPQSQLTIGETVSWSQKLWPDCSEDSGACGRCVLENFTIFVRGSVGEKLQPKMIQFLDGRPTKKRAIAMSDHWFEPKSGSNKTTIPSLL